ncbi:MAG: hypothetical protein GEU74_01640 [Nitriliruptorales bacterium]|nr:hypothetical protein [Nitriliruptorales bacterium]
MTRRQPPRPAARPSRRRRRPLLRLLAGFVVAVLVGVATAAGAVHWGLAKIDRTTVAGLVNGRAQAAESMREDVGPRLLNVLVVGNDSRDGMTAEERRTFGTGRFDGARTDTIMLLQLEVGGPGRSAVLSFPRDLLVTRCDGTRGRINAAHGIGVERDGDGASCLVETVSDVTGVSINHYVEVSFAGFLRVVDALGGVDLYLDEPLYDEKAHLDVPAGCVRLEGASALGFVRARHLDNDFGRIARQQRFLKEALREATDVGVLANPSKLYRIIDAAAGSLQTDEDLGLAEMREIALGMQSLTANGLEVYTVPGEATVRNSSWYVVEDSKAAEALYASFRDGSVVRNGPPSPPEDDRPGLPPVTVLNASDRVGAAAAAAAVVEADAFTVSEVGNAEIGGLDRTRILHPPAFASAAERLAELFPGADVIEGVDGLPLTVKLGADAAVDELRERARASEAATESRGHAPSSAAGGDRAEKERAPATEPTYRGAGLTDVDC